jgi:hypothetical protein
MQLHVTASMLCAMLVTPSGYTSDCRAVPMRTMWTTPPCMPLYVATLRKPVAGSIQAAYT